MNYFAWNVKLIGIFQTLLYLGLYAMGNYLSFVVHFSHWSKNIIGTYHTIDFMLLAWIPILLIFFFDSLVFVYIFCFGFSSGFLLFFDSYFTDVYLHSNKPPLEYWPTRLTYFRRFRQFLAEFWIFHNECLLFSIAIKFRFKWKPKSTFIQITKINIKMASNRTKITLLHWCYFVDYISY